MANKAGGTLYVGITSKLIQRIYEHREGVIDGFTKRYQCKLLVWYELHSTMESAIVREKQLKAGSRKKKIALIDEMNPGWRDLYPEILGDMTLAED